MSDDSAFQGETLTFSDNMDLPCLPKFQVLKDISTGKRCNTQTSGGRILHRFFFSVFSEFIAFLSPKDFDL